MHLDQLRTLLAVLDEGTFEAAADELRVTPSAVSQRIKALESSLGNVLVQRTVPCAPTPAGEAVVRMARQVVFLDAETRAELGQPGPTSVGAPLPIAVNADSLATWFRDVLPVAACWPDVAIQVHVEDQEHSARLLRRGEVLAAVTSDPRPVGGCRVVPLTVMRYRPMATPTLRDRYTRGRGVDWSAMPALQFNAVDELQLEFLRRRRVDTLPPMPRIPSSEGFVAGVRAGLGWGLLPDLQVDDAVRADLVLLHGDVTDVPLYWQVWSLVSPRLERLTQAVLDAAGATSASGPALAEL